MQIPVGYREHIPTPHSIRSIERVWSFSASNEGSSIILPDGRSDLIVRFKVDKGGLLSSLMPIVTSPATRPFSVCYEQGDMWVGLRLRPELNGVLWRGEVQTVNEAYRGDSAIGLVPMLSKIHAKGCSVFTLTQIMTGIAEQLRATRVSAIALNALKLCHVSGGRLKVGDLARYLSCSPRHLQRTFKSAVGIPPKSYSAIIQFHRALNFITTGGLNASEAALEAGYSDQSHMVRSFQMFGGFTPSYIPPNLSFPELPK